MHYKMTDLFLHGCIVSSDTNLPRMTLLFQCEALNPRTQRQRHKLNPQTSISPFRSGFFFAPCKKQQQPHFFFVPNRSVKARLSKKTLRTYLLVSGSKSSHVPLLILVCYCGYCYYGGHRYVSASAMLLSLRGLCGPVRYIRAVEESE